MSKNKAKKQTFNHSARAHAVPQDDGVLFLRAAEEGDLDTLELYLNKYGQDILEIRQRDWMKASQPAGDSCYHTALMYAVWQDHKDAVDMLIKHGADVNAKLGSGGTTVLMLSHSNEMSKRLLEKGAKLEGTDNNGGTALMWPHTPDAIRFLISQGANVHARDKEGQTALIRLGSDNYVHHGAPPTQHMRLLLDAGADIDAQDVHGRTALIVAAARSAYDDDTLDKIEYLLKRGADPDLRDKDGNTAAMLARVPRPDLEFNVAQQDAVAALLDKTSAERAENTRKLFIDGPEQGVGVMKPLQLKR